MTEICYNTDCPYNKWHQCERTATCITQLTDGYWYHGNGTIGGEFHPTKPNDEERYGEYVKVKHGRWIWNKRLGEWYCSNCDRIMNPYTVEKSEGVYEMAQPFYCGWCGAKMDLTE